MANATRDHYSKVSFALAENCLRQVVEHLEGEERDEAIAKLRTFIKNSCKLEKKAEITAACIEETKSQLEEQGHEAMPFMQIFDSKVIEKESDIGDMEAHPKFVAFEKKITLVCNAARAANSDSNDDGDDELMVTEAQVNTIDPFSQQTMVSPVKNKICGHSYEKTVVMQMLRNGKQMRCPYVGCPSGRPFGRDDLVEDEQLKQILMQRRPH